MIPSTLPSILRQANAINETQETALYDLSMLSGCSVPEGATELNLCQAQELVAVLADVFGLPIVSIKDNDYASL
ncbi:type IV-A pilus assembly ATPase PilB, partial [Vibrio alfacsensis]